MERAKKVLIIAEAGVNHNGEISQAIKLIEKAKEVGADIIKFQTFKANQVATKSSPKAKYQLGVTDPQESQLNMLKALELDYSHYKEIVRKCKDLEIGFMSTPYGFGDADFLNDLGVEAFKIASGQLTELPFLRYIARMGKPMILSTGMANMAEVFEAVEAIREEGNEQITVLQCTTNYPSRVEDANVLAMCAIRDACKVTVGYSDHVETNYATYAAVALGAEVIEKHFTLDRNAKGPDHSSSLDSEGFRTLVKGIREIEAALGTGLKVPSEAEKENTFGMKRSLVAAADIAKGTIIDPAMLGFKRPENGLAVNMYDSVIGKKAAKAIEADEPLQMDSIVWEA